MVSNLWVQKGQSKLLEQNVSYVSLLHPVLGLPPSGTPAVELQY